MSSVIIRGGDGNHYPAIVNSEGKLLVDTELTVSGITVENVTTYKDRLGALRFGLVDKDTRRVQVDIATPSGTIDVAVPDGVGVHYITPIAISGIAVHDVAAVTTGPQIMGAYDSTKPAAVADGDAVRVLTDQYGRLLAGMEPERFQATVQSFDATSATSVKAKTADKKMYLTTVAISASGAMSVRLQDDAGTPNIVVDETYLGASGSIVLPFNPSAPLVVTTNQDLDMVTNVAGGVTVTIAGYLAT